MNRCSATSDYEMLGALRRPLPTGTTTTLLGGYRLRLESFSVFKLGRSAERVVGQFEIGLSGGIQMSATSASTGAMVNRLGIHSETPLRRNNLQVSG
jgi:hypothetical protein